MAMSRESERRKQPDRRRAARGGRRPDDPHGFTPLVLVVGDGAVPQRESETILRELKFAVAPAADLQEALKVVEGLHPDLIVARAEDAPRLRGAASVPIIEYEMTDADGHGRDLVDGVLAAIRKRR